LPSPAVAFESVTFHEFQNARYDFTIIDSTKNALQIPSPFSVSETTYPGE
jgi:hypothetical protein